MMNEEEIFEAAVALPAGERAAYLDAACAGLPEMRVRIEALLRSHDDTGFMEVITSADRLDPQAERSRSLPEEAGDTIGRYKLLEQIGEGGFGVVWVAEQMEPVRRRVALKIIKPGMDSREIIRRFEQERQALAMMDHPNIAKVLDAGATDNGRPYFVMELVRGAKITGFCDQANLPTAERLKLFITVCQAVQHAHQKGIIHRDLKPSNILVTAGDDGLPAPKVIDFGVAKAMQQPLTDETVYTQFEQMIGTPAYMSPEQAGLGPMDIDTRSDVYALGVLLYELLAGRPPFDSKELLSAGYDEMRRVIREVDPPRPSTRVSTLEKGRLASLAQNRQAAVPKLISALRGDLDWIVMKALEKNRTRRYETANGLAADIQRFLNDRPVAARPPSFAYRFGKFVRKYRGPVTAAAAVFVTLLAGLATSTVLYVRESTALANESVQRKRAEAGENTATTESTKNRQTAKFLEEMLKTVSPEEAMGEDTKLLRRMLKKTAARVATDLESQPLVEAHLHYIIGDTYRALGLYAEARIQFEKDFGICRRVLGPEHEDTLSSRSNLGVLLIDEGKQVEAEAEIRALLPVMERVQGVEHPETLIARKNLGVALAVQGKSVEAEAEYRAVLSLREKISGPQDPDTLRSRLDVINVLVDRQQYAEADRNYREVLQLMEKSGELGPDHPDTLRCRGNLAISLHRQRRFEEAEAEHRTLLQSMKRILGPDHPNTLGCRINIANMLWDRGMYREAVAERRAVVEDSKRVFGPEHARTLGHRHGLAETLFRQGQFAEAEAEFRTMLGIYEHTPGPEHLDTLASRADIARVLAARGKSKEAEVENREVLAILERVAGPEHRQTLAIRNNIAGELNARGQYDDAEREYRELFKILERTCGPEDQETLSVRNNLGTALYFQNKFAEAEAEYRAVLAVRERLYGGDHPITLGSRANLAGALDSQGEYAEAEMEHRAVLQVRERVLGPDHPLTLRSLHNTAMTLKNRNKLTEAAGFARRASEGARAALGPEHRDTAVYENLHQELASKSSAGTAPVPAASSSTASPASVPSDGKPVTAPSAVPVVRKTLVPSDSAWKWLHPVDGQDPENSFPDFHKHFPRVDFDDSKWNTGRDSDEPDGGFGYGGIFDGVNMGKPEKMANRRTAYFRHTFKTDKAAANLELRCRRDDGIIVYLDGKEVLRDNMEEGPDAFLLPAKVTVQPGDEIVSQRFPIPGKLAAGTHTLAISVHNTLQPSTDLRLGGVKLVEVEAEAGEK